MKKLVLTREVTFSSGHRLWIDELSKSLNISLFGKYGTPFNHGHNYRLQASVSGAVNPTTGMVVNIKDLDDLLQTEIVNRFHLKSINDEVPELVGKVPTLENLLRFARAHLADEVGRVALHRTSAYSQPIQLHRIRIYEMPDFWADWTEKMTTLTRSYEFAAAHRLHVQEFTEDENYQLFGKCNNPNGHGHNYILEVSVTGKLDSKTGMMVDLAHLDHVVESQVVGCLDHKNLDLDVPGLAGHPTTTENLTLYIDRVLGEALGPALVKVRLFETARSSFEVDHE